MKRLLLASLCLFAFGCGGNSGSNPVSFAGAYSGTWVNTEDATDTGTSTWTIDANGTVQGNDFETGDGVVYDIEGTIDGRGNLTAMTDPTSDEGPVPLTGRLSYDSQNRLTGTLTWAANPPLTYRYTFTRQVPE
ncbi:MAG: hypothetical protein ACO1SV_22550 [Fimbriimonas sp.]